MRAKAREALNKAKQLNGENLEIRYQEVKLFEIEGKNTEALAALNDLRRWSMSFCNS